MWLEIPLLSYTTRREELLTEYLSICFSPAEIHLEYFGSQCKNQSSRKKRQKFYGTVIPVVTVKIGLGLAADGTWYKQDREKQCKNLAVLLIIFRPKNYLYSEYDYAQSAESDYQ